MFKKSTYVMSRRRRFGGQGEGGDSARKQRQIRANVLLYVVLCTTVLALSACSGGGSGVGPAGPMLTPIIGLTGIGPATVVSNATTPNRIADALPNEANKYKPLVAFVTRDTNAGTDDYGTGLAGPDVFEMTEISSDGDRGFKLSYKLYGTPTTVHLSKDDFATDRYKKGTDSMTGFGYWLWSETGAFNNGASNAGGTIGDYFDINSFIIVNFDANRNARGYLLYGARTETANLPTGTATYNGGVMADFWNVDDPRTDTSRTRTKGDATLNMDLANGTLSGLLDNFRKRDPGQTAFSPLAGQTVRIADGKIVDGQFTAKLTGSGTLLDGLTGDALGEFFGPAADEVGAVINGRLPSQNQVFDGYIHGDKQ